MASLVFIGHEATRTGAPYTQLYLLQWLRANTDHTVELVLLEGGALVPEFEKVATVHILNQYAGATSLGSRVLRKIDSLTQRHLRGIYAKLKKTNPALIYANASMSLAFGTQLKQELNVPLILHLHELKWTFFYLDAAAFAASAQAVDFFIPCSNAVKEFHQPLCAIPNEKLRTVYSFTGLRPHDISTAQSIRHELGIPAGARVVGAAGALNWGKGADLFLGVAQKFKEQGHTDTYFVWVGGNPASVDYQEFAHDIEQMGLADRVRCVAARADIQGFYQAFEVLLLPSRMDPFPLVCLEAALAQRPTVCFAAGGMPEFLRDDAGLVVPYADTRAMAEKTRWLLDHDAERQQMGRVGQQRAQTHHTIEAIGPQLYAVMQQFLPAVPKPF